MIERIDEKTVRIKYKDIYYYLEIPEEFNLIIIEQTFIRGFEEGKKNV